MSAGILVASDRIGLGPSLYWIKNIQIFFGFLPQFLFDEGSEAMSNGTKHLFDRMCGHCWAGKAEY